MKQEGSRQWYRLDNTAKAFPPLVSKRITTLFRISLTLKEHIVLETLQQALDNCLIRFPYFQVELRTGFFWFYFEPNHNRAVVEADSQSPCMNYSIRKSGYFPFRVRAYYKRIALEFSHTLTDGTGALNFLKCLVTEYLRLRGKPVPQTADYPLCGETPSPEEEEDAYLKNRKPGIPSPPRGPKAYHIKGRRLPRGEYRITTGLIPIQKALARAKERNTSLTEYLLAQYMAALQDILEELPPRKRRRKARPIRVSLPVNLRPLFDSCTMRNFFLHVEPSLDPRLGHYTLEEIITKVHHSLGLLIDPKFIQQQISRNIQGEQHPLIRLLPVFIKSTVIRRLYRRWGESRISSGFSNLGRITLPPEIEGEVTAFRFIPPPSPVTGVKGSLVTYQDTLSISLGRELEEKKLERYFFTRLRKDGIPVKIESN